MTPQKISHLLLLAFVLTFTPAYAAEDDIAKTEAKVAKAMTEECRAFAADPQPILVPFLRPGANRLWRKCRH